MTTTPNEPPVDYRTPGTPEGDEAEKLVLTSPDAAEHPRDFALWAGVLFLIALTIYSPALRGLFLWDDDRHVTHNATLRTADGLRRIWFEPKATPQYYPLTHTTYWIEYQLFGQGAGPQVLNPLVFHVTNVLLHATGAVLLWFILRRLRVPGAWLAAAVFAVHPVHAESVAWISERKNVLSGALLFGSILAYLRFERIGDRDDSPALPPRDDWNRYALAFGLFAAALLSKTVACSAPAVLLLILWWKRGRLRGADVLPLVPMFVVGIAAAAMTSWMERTHVIGRHYAMGDWDLSFAQRILIAGRAIWFYLTKLLLPVELTFTYPRWEVAATQVWQWLFVIAVIAATVATWLLRTRIGRAPLVAWLIYVGVLVPALGFFDVYPMRYSFVADHFQYHASPAMIALLVGGAVLAFRRLSKRPERPVDVEEQSPTPYVASGAVLLVLAALTWWQTRIYADPVTLWRDTVAKNPAAWMAHHNLGIELTELARAYQRLGDTQSQEHAQDLLNEAAGRLEMSVRLRPSHDMAIMHWGRTLLAQGKDAEAMAKFEEALRVNPHNVEALTNRAFMLQKAGKQEEALAGYREALAECERGPAVTHARCGHIARLLGEMLEGAGKLQEAEEAYARAVTFTPGNLDARYAYGTLLARRAGGPPEQRKATLAAAADEFLAILRRNPSHQDAQISLAMLMIEAGNLPGAQRELIQAARIDANAPRLMEAAKLFDAAVKQYEASTQPSTTQSATQPTTQAASAMQAATQPSSSTQPVP